MTTTNGEIFFKYLTISERDEEWGIVVTDAGFAKVPPSSDYPLGKHPDSHQFTWEKGRVLHEYQLVYIAHGKGEFESEFVQNKPISSGTAFLLFPNIWHRYRPVLDTGWNEFWIGFKGPYADRLVQNGFFSGKEPLLQIGYSEPMLRIFNQVIEYATSESPGYQQIISGATAHLLGIAFAANKQFALSDEGVEALVSKARLRMLESVDKPVDPEQLANQLGVGYSWFRKMFKEYTGMAPGQYHIQLKIHKAREMLNYSTLPVKEIAYRLGFESDFYFARIFKQKTGFSPNEFRKTMKK